MMNTYLLSFIMACTTDVSIMKVDKQNNNDTSESIVADEDTFDENIQDQESEDVDYSLVSGKITYHFRQIACPACVGATSEFDISAEVKLHLPTSADYFDLYNYEGACTEDIYNIHVGSTPIQDTSPIYLNGLQHSITLNYTGDGTWAVQNLSEIQYERQTIHNLETSTGLVDSAFKTVEGFDFIEPYTLLWVDPSYAFDAPVYRSGATFTWGPPIQDSKFEVLIAVYSWDGTQFLGAVSCLENDSGVITVPGQYLQTYPQGSLTAVHLTRHRMSSVRAPNYNGTIQTHMLWEVVGTGHIE